MGFPFPQHMTDSYIHHSVILEYLNTFARHYNIHEYIKVDFHYFSVDSIMNFIVWLLGK